MHSLSGATTSADVSHITSKARTDTAIHRSNSIQDPSQAGVPGSEAIPSEGGVRQGLDPGIVQQRVESKNDSAQPVGNDSEEESSDEMSPPPAIFNATKHPELTDIPPDVIERLAQEFVEKVKQGGWDNTSEAYRKNWEKAVEEANESFKAAFGYDAYLKLTSGGTN